MPIYEYICADCRNCFEVLRPMKDADTPMQCTCCQSQRTTRLISVFNAQSGGHALAGSMPSGCAGCAATSCSGCGN